MYNVIDKLFSKDSKVIKLIKSRKKHLSQISKNLKKLKNKKEFRKKVLETIGANLINSIWRNYQISEKEVRTLWN